MALWIFKNERQEGPFEDAEAHEMIYEGKYAVSDLAFREGMTEWKPLGELLGRGSAARLSAGAAATTVAAPVAAQPQLVTRASAPPVAPSAIYPTRVVVTDFQMPFGSMVIFILKWALAAIPAALIFFAVFFFLWMMLFGLLAGLIGIGAASHH